MPIKVVHVVRQYHPSVGGMEDVVHNIARQQIERHCQLPIILTLDRLFRNSDQRLAPSEVVDGTQVVRLPFHGSSRYPVCTGVLEHVRDADVIHVHGIDFFFDFLAATRLIHRRPLMVSTHGGFFHTSYASTLKNFYFNTATRLSFRAYNKVVATSDNDGEIFDPVVKSPKMVVIENGVNVEKFADKSATQLKPVLIYFGRWAENKGLHETIAFFQQLVSRQPSWELIIAGREYDQNETELMGLLKKYQLLGSVRLVANPSDPELANLIRQSSYFICQSKHEGFGLAAIEALSAGLTPVLSNIPPFRSLVEQAGVGMLLGGGTDSGIDALLAMHRQGKAGHSKRRALALSFASQYNWINIGDRYADMYVDLADRKFRGYACS